MDAAEVLSGAGATKTSGSKMIANIVKWRFHYEDTQRGFTAA
jgi:hypothetical protein